MLKATKVLLVVLLSGTASRAQEFKNAGGWSHACPPVCADVDGDGNLDIVVAGVEARGIHLLSATGAEKRFLPLPPGVAMSHGGVAVGDLDPVRPGLEMAFVTSDGIYAMDAAGAVLPGWPSRRAGETMVASRQDRCAIVDLGGKGSPRVVAQYFSVDASFSNTHLDVIRASGLLDWGKGHGINRLPPLADADGSFAAGDVSGGDALEVVQFFGPAQLRIHSAGGSNLADKWLAAPPGVTFRDVALGDLTGDRKLEIAVCSTHATGVTVWLLDGSGTILPGWPKTALHEDSLGSRFARNSIALGDVDGDLRPDIVVDQVRRFLAWRADGTVVSSGKMNFAIPVEEAPVLGDVSGDGRPDVVGSAVGALVVAFRATVGAVDGWPKAAPEVSPASPTICDLDGDGDNELVVFAQAPGSDPDSNPGHLSVLETPGKGPSPWPVANGGSSRTGAFVVKRGDADHDGSLTWKDVDFLAAWLFSGGPAPVSLVSADSNADGKVDISDVVHLSSFMQGSGPAPAR